jgi:hypothetical protein
MRGGPNERRLARQIEREGGGRFPQLTTDRDDLPILDVNLDRLPDVETA